MTGLTKVDSWQEPASDGDELAVANASASNASDDALRIRVRELERSLAAVQENSATSSQETLSLQTRLREVELNAEKGRREAMLEAVESGKHLSARVHEQESMVAARDQRIQQLEEEMMVQSRSHVQQLAELQDAFHQKLQDLRGKAAAPGAEVEEVQKQLEKASSSLEREQRQRGQAEAAADELRAELELREQALQELKEDRLRLQQQVADLRQADQARCQELQAEREVAAQLRQQLSSRLQPPPAAEMALQMAGQMEAQLQRLSGVIRERDRQVELLQETVQRECDERAALQQLVRRLRQEHAPPAAGAEGCEARALQQ